MQASTLPAQLRQLATLLRTTAKNGLGLPPVECGRVAVLIHQAAHEADRLTEQVADIPELEDELLAVAHDLDRVAGDDPQTSPSFQTALKAQQRSLQAQLDGAGPVNVPRPGASLSRLSAPIGGSNVVTFPVIARPKFSRVDCQGDGGDAA